MKKFKSVLTLTFVLSVMSASALSATPSALPQSWFELPEDAPVSIQSALNSQQMSEATEDAAADTAASIEKIFELNANALNRTASNASQTEPSSQVSNLTAERPADWTPWHLEFFTTDLTLSATGKVGVMTLSGSPGIQAYWRKQGPKPAVAAALEDEQTPSALPSLEVAPEAQPADIARQVEPVVQMVLAQGKVQNESRLRSELKRAVEEFRQLVLVVEADQPGTSYWVSGFRIDLSIAASGDVSFGTFGIDTRIRLEWKRAMRAKSANHAQKDALASAASMSHLQASLREFVRNIATDLEEASAQNPHRAEFKPYGYRVGLGLNAGKDFGFGKGSATIIGHINFSRDMKKPVVYPTHPAPATGSYLMIEKTNSPQLAQHLAFASMASIPSQSSPSDVTFSVDRARFRKGLSRAMKMGNFFAERTAKTNSSSAQWKIFEMKVGFDLSVTGGSVLNKNKLQATSEMAFYNQKF
jgi:hypothetical protein